jgi:hypothetical protein
MSEKSADTTTRNSCCCGSTPTGRTRTLDPTGVQFASSTTSAGRSTQGEPALGRDSSRTLSLLTFAVSGETDWLNTSTRSSCCDESLKRLIGKFGSASENGSI